MKRRTRACLGSALGVSHLFLHLVAMGGNDVFASNKAERLSHELVFRSGGRLTVENTCGDILVSSWKKERIELTAEKTGESVEEMELVPVEIKSREDEVRVTSVFPVYSPHLKVRVDYRLRVPAEIDLKLLKTINGTIKVSEVVGRAALQVENGEIALTRCSGTLEATSLNGKIDADLPALGPGHFVRLESYNGDIFLRLPERVKAHFALRTMNGSIHSDFPFAIQSNFGPQVVHLSNDVEEPVVRVYSVNGDIHVVGR